jgi:hypothetical protein
MTRAQENGPFSCHGRTAEATAALYLGVETPVVSFKQASERCYGREKRQPYGRGRISAAPAHPACLGESSQRGFRQKISFRTNATGREKSHPPAAFLPRQPTRRGTASPYYTRGRHPPAGSLPQRQEALRDRCRGSKNDTFLCRDNDNSCRGRIRGRKSAEFASPTGLTVPGGG